MARDTLFPRTATIPELDSNIYDVANCIIQHALPYFDQSFVVFVAPLLSL